MSWVSSPVNLIACHDVTLLQSLDGVHFPGALMFREQNLNAVIKDKRIDVTPSKPESLIDTESQINQSEYIYNKYLFTITPIETP
jgi:hypothetical protein